MGLLVAALCVAAQLSPSVVLRTLDPFEAVHFTFVEQETRNYEQTRSGGAETPYVDPWGRQFVEKDLGGEYALYSKGVNGFDDDGARDDILMYGPGLPCYRFGHTPTGAVVKWARVHLFVVAALLCATYVLLRVVSRRTSTAREVVFTGLVGLPLSCTLGAIAGAVYVPALGSGLESPGLAPLEWLVGGSVVASTHLGSFALRRLHGPEHG